MVVFNHITGYPNQVIETLNRKIGQYKRNYKMLKVGITGQNPYDRFYQHRKEIYWNQMIIIYESSSQSHCNALEALLIECHYNDLTNVRAGGGSKLSLPGKNYVYLILK
jgi:hypothetical protein